MKEKNLPATNGYIGLFIHLSLIAFFGYKVYETISTWATMDWTEFILPTILLTVIIMMISGYARISPNDFKIYQFLGKYKGVLKTNGYWFVNPFYGTVLESSFKIVNYQTPTLTVNEKNGIPIEIAAVISWKIVDTYQYLYNVSDAANYLGNQFKVCLRNHAKAHTYNELSGDDHEFLDELNQKAAIAGCQVLEAKIADLSYAHEIAAAMLQKQQAQSMSEAKRTIVENAVDIAKHAADSMNGEMKAEDKSRFIANLIVVLCSDKSATPVVTVE